MSSIVDGTDKADHEPHLETKQSFSLGIQLLLGGACGLLIANLYYAQPLTGLITASLGMPPQSTGLLVTLPLMGYGFGLLAIVPLGDLIENRRLVLTLVGLEALCALAAGLIAQPVPFLGIALLMGVAAAWRARSFPGVSRSWSRWP